MFAMTAEQIDAGVRAGMFNAPQVGMKTYRPFEALGELLAESKGKTLVGFRPHESMSATRLKDCICRKYDNACLFYGKHDRGQKPRRKNINRTSLRVQPQLYLM